MHGMYDVYFAVTKECESARISLRNQIRWISLGGCNSSSVCLIQA